MMVVMIFPVVSAVMVYLHGGAFVAGGAGDQNGTDLAINEHVIVVTVNYRLGAFGKPENAGGT
jgi:carboxylesterase type B